MTETWDRGASLETPAIIQMRKDDGQIFDYRIESKIKQNDETSFLSLFSIFPPSLILDNNSHWHLLSTYYVTGSLLHALYPAHLTNKSIAHYTDEETGSEINLAKVLEVKDIVFFFHHIYEIKFIDKYYI